MLIININKNLINCIFWTDTPICNANYAWWARKGDKFKFAEARMVNCHLLYMLTELYYECPKVYPPCGCPHSVTFRSHQCKLSLYGMHITLWYDTLYGMHVRNFVASPSTLNSWATSLSLPCRGPLLENYDTTPLWCLRNINLLCGMHFTR